MENETKQTNTNEQEPDIFAQKLREADSLYAILSGCTKEPYVYCDPETMDDAILLFTDEEGAKVGAQKLAEQQIPVGIAKVDRKSLLLFYTSLYTMGVNAIQQEWKSLGGEPGAAPDDALLYAGSAPSSKSGDYAGIKRFTGGDRRALHEGPLYRAASRGRKWHSAG